MAFQPGAHSPLASFGRFAQQEHGNDDEERSRTPTSRSPFMPVRQHSSTSPPPSPSPMLSQPQRVTRSHPSESSASSSSASTSSASSRPLLPSSAHNVPLLSFQPSSPTEYRKTALARSTAAPSTTAPKIRARITPAASPRRKALPGTEFADVPAPRGTGSPTKRTMPQPLPLPRAKPVSFREMDDQMEGLGKGLAGLGLGIEERYENSRLEQPRMVSAPASEAHSEDRRTQSGKENVFVCVRMRPPAAKLAQAVQSTDEIAWDVAPRTGTVSLLNQPSTKFIFDSIVTGTDNAGVYEAAGRDLVIASMEGFDAVIFAYGQTASGKTFTLSGNTENPGVIPQAVTEIFSYIQSHPEQTFLLRASYLEIYNETLKDLLAPESGPLKVRQDESKRFFVHPLREEVVTGEDQVAALLKRGEQNRHTGRTDFNERSSRSHSVFQITIESRDDDDVTPPPTPQMRGKMPNTPRLTPGSNGIVRMSRLSLIDLAGSEQATSQTERRNEGAFINKSLLTLEKVIASLTDDPKKATHVPYRDSKLTQILQPSLSGDARVAVIATMNPSPSAIEETKSTLKFATRVKKVMLKALVKEVVGDKALIHKYQSTILELEAKLKVAVAAANTPSTPSTPSLAQHGSRRGKAEEDADVKKLNMNISDLKSLFLNSGNVGDRRKSLLPPRPVSPMKLRRPDELIEEADEATFEERYLDSRDENALLREELEELRLRLATFEGAPVAGDADGRVQELMREVRELRVIADNVSGENELRLQQMRFERQVAQRDEYARDIRARLDTERQRLKKFEAYVIQHVLTQASSFTDDRHGRRSSIGLGANLGAVGAFQSLMSETPDVDAIRPEYVGLDGVDLRDLDFSPEAQAQITRSGSTLFAPLS